MDESQVTRYDRDREILTLRRLEKIERLLEKVIKLLEKDFPPETYTTGTGVTFQSGGRFSPR
jgi:hypothetical protein